MEELKPCPFCGSKWQFIKFAKNTSKFTICTIECECTCSIRQAGRTKEEAQNFAVKYWNSRFKDGRTEN